MHAGTQSPRTPPLRWRRTNPKPNNSINGTAPRKQCKQHHSVRTVGAAPVEAVPPTAPVHPFPRFMAAWHHAGSHAGHETCEQLFGAEAASQLPGYCTKERRGGPRERAARCPTLAVLIQRALLSGALTATPSSKGVAVLFQHGGCAPRVIACRAAPHSWRRPRLALFAPHLKG